MWVRHLAGHARPAFPCLLLPPQTLNLVRCPLHWAGGQGVGGSIRRVRRARSESRGCLGSNEQVSGAHWAPPTGREMVPISFVTLLLESASD